MAKEVFLRGDLARAARALTAVSIKTISLDCGIPREKIRAFEKGGSLNPEEKTALKDSLEKYGAVFLPEADGYGYGVRRKYPREDLFELGDWEDEGGSWRR